MLNIPRNNSNFSSTLFEFYRSLSWKPQWNFLKYYQNTIRAYCDYVDAGSNGLLTYLGMGTGKSILAASIAVDMLTGCEDTGFDSPHLHGTRGRRVKKCIFILNKSLAANMRNAFVKYFALKKAAGLKVPDDVEGWIDKRVFFVSMNASNMITQFVRAATGQGLSGKLKNEDVTPGATLVKDCFIVVDEAHGMLRGITNGSKNGTGFYKIMEASHRQKNHGNFTLLMSGTPINNDAFETVPCMNLLGGEGTLPEDYEDFKEAFVSDDGSRRMKNETHFMDRIAGLVAYTTHETTPGKKIRGTEDTGTGIEFPEDLGVSAVLCPMAPDQYAYYAIAREQEATEGAESARKGPKARGRMQLPRSNATSSYRTKSRQLSNFYEGNLENRDIAQISNPWTPKYAALLSRIEAHNEDIGTLGLVYSQYVGIGGLGSLAVFLKSCGWREYGLTYAVEETDETPQEDTDVIVEDMAEDTLRPDEKMVMADTIIADSIENAPLNVEGGTEWSAGLPSINDDADRHKIYGSGKVLSHNTSVVNHLIHLDEVTGGKKMTSSLLDPYAYAPINTKARKNKIRRGRGEDDSHEDDSLEDDSWDVFISIAPSCNEWDEFIEDSGDDDAEIITGGSKFHNEDGRNVPLKSSKTFAIIKGGLTAESRKKVEEIMTSPDNRHGEIVSMVLVSSVGAEGLDFKAIRHVHILEPYWNWARILQIQYRGIRNDSHKSLPAEEKNVKTYVYCAVPPRPETDEAVIIDTNDMIGARLKDVTTLTRQELNHPGSKSDGDIITLPDTTDISLLYEAIRKYQIIASFLGPMQKASITAAIDDMEGARLCAPTNKTTFTKDISADLKMPDGCRPYIVKKIVPKIVTVAGKEYAYIQDDGKWGFRIFVNDGTSRPPEVTMKMPEFMTILAAVETAEGIALDF